VLEAAPNQAEQRDARADAIIAKARAAVPADLLEATEVLEGRPADELARVTTELDLLICGSRGYGPVRSLLLGGVTWTLAHTTACPLLVVPRAPVPGFRTLTGDPVQRGASA
jgi:nucleotide-binding universal stress UspA family protein